MPKAAVIAGPNGSGKTRFYERVLETQFPVFVNADRIAAAMVGRAPADKLSLDAANVLRHFAKS